MIYNIFFKWWAISHNKNLEIQFAFKPLEVRPLFDLCFNVNSFGQVIYLNLSILGFGINFSWTKNCDHAGVDFEVFLPFIFLNTNFYDKRHWNYDEERPYKEDEDPFKSDAVSCKVLKHKTLEDTFGIVRDREIWQSALPQLFPMTSSADGIVQVMESDKIAEAIKDYDMVECKIHCDV